MKYLDEVEAAKNKEKSPADTEETEKTKVKSAYDKLSQFEKQEVRNEYYKDVSGINVRELASDNELQYH